MSRRCELTDVGVMTGNLISHSNRKARRRFLPNLQQVTLRSEILNKDFGLRITSATIRSVDHNGGLDNFLLTAKAANLSEKAQLIRRQLKKALIEKGVKPVLAKRKKPVSARAKKAAAAKKKAA